MTPVIIRGLVSKVLVIGTLASNSIMGATRTWDGGGTNGSWTNRFKWVGDISIGAGDILAFPVEAAQFETTYAGEAAVIDGKLLLAKTIRNSAIPGLLTIDDGAGGIASDLFQLLGDAQIADTSSVNIATSGWISMENAVRQ